MSELPIGARSPRTSINRNGYVVRRVKTEKGWRYKLEHRLIWEDIHGAIPPGGVIHHRDGDITNNQIDNLELCLNNGKAHLRDKHLDKFQTPEFRQAVSERFKGKPKSLETRRKMSATWKEIKALPNSIQEQILELRKQGHSMRAIAIQVFDSPNAAPRVFRFLDSHGDVIPDHLKKPARWRK